MESKTFIEFVAEKLNFGKSELLKVGQTKLYELETVAR